MHLCFAHLSWPAILNYVASPWCLPEEVGHTPCELIGLHVPSSTFESAPLKNSGICYFLCCEGCYLLL